MLLRCFLRSLPTEISHYDGTEEKDLADGNIDRDDDLTTSSVSTSAFLSSDFHFKIEEDKSAQTVIEEYKRFLRQRTFTHFGYPYNLNFDHFDVVRISSGSVLRNA